MGMAIGISARTYDKNRQSEIVSMGNAMDRKVVHSIAQGYRIRDSNWKWDQSGGKPHILHYTINMQFVAANRSSLAREKILTSI